MQLSRREKDVLKYISLPTETIAKRMYLSKATIMTHITRLRQKLQANSSRMVLAQALKQKLITVEELVTE